MTEVYEEIELAPQVEKEISAHGQFSAVGVDLTVAFTNAIKQASQYAETYRVEAIVQAENEAIEVEAAAKVAGGSKGMIIADRNKARAASAYINTQRQLVTKLAADLVPHAVLQLAAIVANPLEAGSVRVQAIDRLTDRAIGKTTTPMRVSRDDLYKLPVMEALNLLGEMASNGSMTVEEVGGHQRLLETRVKALELEQLTTRMDELERQLTGKAPSSSGSSAMN